MRTFDDPVISVLSLWAFRRRVAAVADLRDLPRVQLSSHPPQSPAHEASARPDELVSPRSS